MDRTEVFALVREHWIELGYTVTERIDEGSVVSMRLAASRPDGLDLTFMAADLGMTLDGVSTCVPDVDARSAVLGSSPHRTLASRLARVRL